MDWVMHKAKAKVEERKQKYLDKWGAGSTFPGQHRHHEQSESQSSLRPSYQAEGLGDFHAVCFQALPAPKQSKPEECGDIIGNVEYLGDVRSKTTYVIRDLGFQGQIGQYILLSYGDTLWTDSTYNGSIFRGMTSNSVAYATHNPLQVVDPKLNHDGYPEMFVPTNPAWGEDPGTWAVGITNVVETNPGEGILYYLLNHRPGGKDHIIGAGIARVNLDYSKYPPLPHGNRISRWMWDGETEPWFGDVGAIKVNGFIYSYGHKKDSAFVFLARVKENEWDRVECYDYWHGQRKGWSKDRLTGDLSEEDGGVFWQVNQGQVVWNEYLKKFIFIYCDNFWDRTVILRYASSPEGPWSRFIDVYKAENVTKDGNIYAAVPHPYFDPSGKTLIISFTNFPNCIQAIKVTFT